MGLAPSVYGLCLPDPLGRRSRHLGGWPSLSHPAEEFSPCGSGTCFLSTSALWSRILGVGSTVNQHRWLGRQAGGSLLGHV
jgi:hypothetical protein